MVQGIAGVLPWNQSGVTKEQQDELLDSFGVLNANWAAWRATLTARAADDC